MAEYYKTHPHPISPVTHTRTQTSHTADTHSDFDKMHEALLATDAEEGWASELRCYLGTMQQDVIKDTDSVCHG